MSHPLVLTLNSHGHPLHWVNWQDAIVAKVKGLVSWSLGETEIEVKGGTSRLTGERTIITVPTIIAINNEHRNTRVPVLTNINLFRRDLHICGYCGRMFMPDKLSRDHIIPVSKGGKDNWMNVITACKRCNNEKDDLSIDEWNKKSLKETGEGRALVYLPYTPDRSEQLILQNRNILQDQMEYIKSFIPDHSRLHNK
jgi:5-methylcytosine-specific restriction endonuclease McrA